MRYNHILLLLVILTSLSSVSALECQYTADMPVEKEVEQWYCGFKEVDGSVYVQSSHVDRYKGSVATVRNDFDFEVTVRVVFPVYNPDRISVLTVPANAVAETSVTGYAPNGVYVQVVEPSCLEMRREIRTVQETICKQCAGGNCTNDGDQCVRNTQCGSGFCVEGICSPNNFCYGGTCDCSPGEVQCPDASQCVTRGSVSLGASYICSPLECENGYGEDGICVFSAVQQEEREATVAAAQRAEEQELALQRKTEQQKTALFILGVIVGIPATVVSGKAVYKLLNEYIIVSRFRAMAEKDRASRDLIERTERALQDKHDRESEEQILKELKRMKKEQAEPEDTIYDFGPEVQQWLNPKRGNYPCFVVNGKKTDRLIDREIAEDYIYNRYRTTLYDIRYPGLSFSDLVVHHIDNERKNYDLNNLVIISKDEKSLLDLPKIVDRKSGMEELKRIGASARHIAGLP